MELNEQRLLCHVVLAYGEVSLSEIYESGELLINQKSPTILDLQVVLAFSLSENQREIAATKLLNHPHFQGTDLEKYYKLFAFP